jgi:hypothetical protein
LQLRDVRVIRPEPAALAGRDPHGDLWQHDPDACCKVRKTQRSRWRLPGSTHGSPGASASRSACAGSCRRSSRSGRAAGSRSIRWRPGPPRMSSAIAFYTTCPGTRSPTGAIARSAASPARVRLRRASRSGPAAGLASTSPNAAFT